MFSFLRYYVFSSLKYAMQRDVQQEEEEFISNAFDTLEDKFNPIKTYKKYKHIEICQNTRPGMHRWLRSLLSVEQFLSTTAL